MTDARNARQSVRVAILPLIQIRDARQSIRVGIAPAPTVVTATGTGAIVFAGAGAAAGGTGAVLFAGSGNATVTVLFGTGRITFDGSGLATTTGGVITGTGAIVFGGVGDRPTTGPTGGRIVFDGHADADVAPRLDVYAPPEWSWNLLDTSGAHLAALSAAMTRRLTFQLDGPASAQFVLPADHPQAELVAELATDILVTRNGRSLLRGRVGASSETHAAGNDSVQLTAVDYRGMLDHRLLWGASTLEFAGVDQSDIAWRAIADAQALPGGGLGITRGRGAVTGVVRDRTYTAGTAIGRVIKELGNIAGGFDWDIDPSLVFNVYHPQRGRSAPVVLTYGKEIVATTATTSPAEYGNAVYYTGASPDTVPVEAVASSFPAGVGRWEIQRADPNLVLQATVEQQAAGALADVSQLVPALSVTLAADQWNPYELWLGDSVRVIIQTGRLDIDVTRRVVQIDVTLDDDGMEVVVLAIGAAPPRLSDRLAKIRDDIGQLQLAQGDGGGGGGDGGGGGGGGFRGIEEITSSDGSIIVTNARGPTTNLILASGGLITVLNPTGPVVDLSLDDGGPAGDAKTISVTHTVALRWWWSVPYVFPAFDYFRGFGSGPWLEEVPGPDGYGTRSRITQPGTYSARASFTVVTPLTSGHPNVTHLDALVEPHAANFAVDWQDPYGPPGASGGNISVYIAGWRKEGHTEGPGFSALDIERGRYAFCHFSTGVINTWVNGGGEDYQDAIVTVAMSITRIPPP